MTDPRVAAAETKLRRVNEAIISLIVIGAGYFFAILWFLNQVSLTQGWTVAVILPFPLLIVAVMGLRIWRPYVAAALDLEKTRAALESIDALEAALAENKRKKRRETD